ncbi:hypothetical protein HIM_10979 [Hirsutella minnesotensis 3608]|uniref:DUF659 domain-containing protein n=1 Tax=Hirsutella minnesotensis 3608 TaxID=1043627 RepID=A0A0F7ZJH5_9HYPO|nr:hypothetical protein HIM_10979 [Hirsutella minnesotensis 3608]
MKQAMNSLWPRRTCRKVRDMWPQAVGALFRGGAAVTGVAPGSCGRFKEGDDKCLVGKLFIVAARDSDADRRVSRLIVYFVTDGSVIVYFVSVQVCKPSRAVVYDVIVPFLAGLNGRCAKVVGPFGLAFYKQITGGFVCGANGPAGIHLKDLRDPIELKARLAGYMSSYGVADVVSGRCVGFKADEDPELENQYFRELLFFLNPALLNHLPKAAKTIRGWVMDAFLSKKQQLKEDLQRSRSRISISFDLWTSPNPYAILGVVAMWIDATGKRRSTVLGMRRVHGEHSGENLGSTVLELLKEYDIGGDQIGYFMLDNASSNDTAVEFILKELCPWMKPQQRRHRRLRCLGHIVNLCCQAFLMGRNCEKYLAKLEKHHQRGGYVKVEELWKKFGCLGRLHNLVRYIRLTPQRREEFAAIIIGGDLSEFDGLELIQNNSTRWNSWFHSITRALNVRERLEIFSARHVPGKGSQGISNFKLDGQHWFELEKIELALKDFFAATMPVEGNKTSLADWFSTLDCLLREINETKDHYHDIHKEEDDNNFTWKYLQGCADAAWSKCEELPLTAETMSSKVQ